MVDCKGDLSLTLSYQKFANDIAVVNRLYLITANRAAGWKYVCSAPRQRNTVEINK